MSSSNNYNTSKKHTNFNNHCLMNNYSNNTSQYQKLSANTCKLNQSSSVNMLTSNINQLYGFQNNKILSNNNQSSCTLPNNIYSSVIDNINSSNINYNSVDNPYNNTINNISAEKNLCNSNKTNYINNQDINNSKLQKELNYPNSKANVLFHENYESKVDTSNNINNNVSNQQAISENKKTHKEDMNCLQNCLQWYMNISQNIINKQINNNNNNNNNNISRSVNIDRSKEKLNENIVYESNKSENLKTLGKNYFLNKLLINYCSLLSDFNIFKNSSSFLDFFFVKSMDQNKDKIEFIKINPEYLINNYIIYENSIEANSFKFFVDYDVSTKNKKQAKKSLDIINNNINQVNNSLCDIKKCLYSLSKEILNYCFVFSFNGNIHKTKLFSKDIDFKLSGYDLVLIITQRILKLTQLNNNISNNNDAFCNMISNKNFNFGVFIKIEDYK